MVACGGQACQHHSWVGVCIFGRSCHAAALLYSRVFRHPQHPKKGGIIFLETKDEKTGDPLAGMHSNYLPSFAPDLSFYEKRVVSFDELLALVGYSAQQCR